MTKSEAKSRILKCMARAMKLSQLGSHELAMMWVKTAYMWAERVQELPL